MPRVEGLAWRNPFLEQSVQKIVLRFYREVMNVAPDFIHRPFVFLNQVSQRQKCLWRRGRMHDCGLASLRGRWIHRENVQKRGKQWRERLPHVVGGSIQRN